MFDYGSGFVELKDVVGNLMKVKGVFGDFMFWKVVSEDGYIVFYLIDGIIFKVLEWGGVQVELVVLGVMYFYWSEFLIFMFICSGVNKSIVLVCMVLVGWIVMV